MDFANPEIADITLCQENRMPPNALYFANPCVAAYLRSPDHGYPLLLYMCCGFAIQSIPLLIGVSGLALGLYWERTPFFAAQDIMYPKE